MSKTADEREWPALAYEQQVWSSNFAQAGPAATRLSSHGEPYQSVVPACIAELTPRVHSDTAQLAAEAERQLSAFDNAHGDRMRAFAPILLRSEAAASSQIENLTASARSIFTAEFGGKSKNDASLIVANTRTMEAAIDLAGDLSTASMREMHRVLLESEPRHTPGKYRDQPVWIGSNAHSPVGAVFVAPHAPRVPALMDDLSVFASRYDLRPLVQVALAHAQFEAIHPFSDGNGRTGRALAQSMIRRTHLTNNVAVPVSAGLLTDISGYHQALTDYRAGNIESIVEQFAVAALRAVPNGRKLVEEIDAIHELSLDKVRPRKGSAKRRLVKYVMRQPVFTAEIAATAVGVSPTNLYRDLRALEEAGVIIKSVEYRGPTTYRSPEVLAAIDAFAERAGQRT